MRIKDANRIRSNPDSGDRGKDHGEDRGKIRGSGKGSDRSKGRKGENHDKAIIKTTPNLIIDHEHTTNRLLTDICLLREQLHLLNGLALLFPRGRMVKLLNGVELRKVNV